LTAHPASCKQQKFTQENFQVSFLKGITDDNNKQQHQNKIMTPN